jgi:hypothetical protein
MKFKITELDYDAACKVAVKIEYIKDGEVVGKQILHFDPENFTEQDALKQVALHAPEIKEEKGEDPKETAAKALVASLESKVGKSIDVPKLAS